MEKVKEMARPYTFPVFKVIQLSYPFPEGILTCLGFADFLHHPVFPDFLHKNFKDLSLHV
jgi:hypothetical protein